VIPTLWRQFGLVASALTAARAAPVVALRTVYVGGGRPDLTIEIAVPALVAQFSPLIAPVGRHLTT
jgi:hypothetical protein